jgi:hypothetical protein
VLGALKTAAKRAGLASSVGLHTLRHGRLGNAVGWRASQVNRAPWSGLVARSVLNHAHFPLIVAPASRVPEVNPAR